MLDPEKRLRYGSIMQPHKSSDMPSITLKNIPETL
ncbi:MAG: hypothetical protein QG672_2583, partial [Pseudomonadota bacterium]|nr:hypothetical protein [Pseudomonadota bacterium]